MLRRMKQTKGGKDASLPATAFLDVRPLEEDVNRANHDHHPSSTTQTPTAMQSPMPSSSAASPSSYGNVPGKLFAREDKENYLYKSIPPASTRQGRSAAAWTDGRRWRITGSHHLRVCYREPGGWHTEGQHPSTDTPPAA